MNVDAPAIPTDFSDLGLEVPVGSIELELRKLWEQDEARTNASLINLAVYSERPDGLVENSALVSELTREHACRAILVGVDRSISEAGLRAWITAHCHLAEGRKSVCCEQIAFHLTGRVTGRFRNTVFAHLNSDLPLIFWWQGELTDVFSERLASGIDRLIVDSSSWADPAAGFARIEEVRGGRSRPVLQDLAWTRTWQFRVGVAAMFDDPPAQRLLPEIREVEIRHHPRHRNSALQMLAWLAVQAGWRDGEELRLDDERSGDGRETRSFESKGGVPIRATLVADEASAPLGRVEISGGELVVRLSREAGAAHVRRELDCGGRHMSSLSPADPDRPVDLVKLQLARGGKNSLYQKSLPRFLSFLKA